MQANFKKIFSLGAIYGIGSAAEKLQSIIFLPLYTRYLSPADFGVLALLVLIADLIGKVIITPLVAGLGRYYYKPDWVDKKKILVFNLFIFLGIQCAIAAVLYWLLSSWVAVQVFGSTQLLKEVQAYGYIIFLRPFFSFLTTLVRLLEMARYYISVTLPSLAISVGVVLYLLMAENFGLLALIYGEICRLVLVLTACLFVWWKNSKFKISIEVIKEPLKFGYPQMLSGFSNLLIQSGDRYLLQAFASISSVGLYSFGYKIASVINFTIVGPLKLALLPTILRSEGNPSEQRNLLSSMAKNYYVFAVFICLGLSLFAREVIMLLTANEEFWPCWVIIPVIAFAYVQHGLGNFVGWGIVMKNKAYLISVNIGIAAIVNIGLNILFIPLWGISGAAIATLISYIVWNSLKMYFSAKLYDLVFDLKRLSFTTACGLSLYFLGVTIGTSESLLTNAAIKLLVLFVYPFFFWYFDFFNEEEKTKIRAFWASFYRQGLRGISPTS